MLKAFQAPEAYRRTDFQPMGTRVQKRPCFRLAQTCHPPPALSPCFDRTIIGATGNSPEGS
jgi:hypothetical protein